MVEFDLNRIYCGDNISWMRQMPNNCIDLTVTSPPYDNLREYDGFSWDFETLARELYRVTKDGGVVVWVVGDATVKGSETGT
jgi:site-specific DNA-methyltransferase (adenine-specific)